MEYERKFSLLYEVFFFFLKKKFKEESSGENRIIIIAIVEKKERMCLPEFSGNAKLDCSKSFFGYFKVLNIFNLLPSAGKSSNVPEEEYPESKLREFSFLFDISCFQKDRHMFYKTKFWILNFQTLFIPFLLQSMSSIIHHFPWQCCLIINFLFFL